MGALSVGLHNSRYRQGFCAASVLLQPMLLSAESDSPTAVGRELVKEPEVRAAFLLSPLVELAAFAAFHFLELLVGPKAAGLRVKDPAKLGALLTCTCCT